MALTLATNDRTLLFALVGALTPIVGIVCAAVKESKRRRRSGVTPPQTEKLLRPPGYSLSLKFEGLNESMLTTALWAGLWCGCAGVMTANAIKVAAQPLPFWFRLVVWLLPICFVAPGFFCAKRTFGMLLASQNIKLGLRGEQATAEALNEVSDAGFRSFHDLQPDRDWNIDHIAAGPRGVFVLETKTRSRRGPGNGLKAHEVKLEVLSLSFPCGTREEESTAQASRNARWLSDYLSKRTGEVVEVTPVVVLPGWYVLDDRKGPVRAMSCNYLTQYLRNQSEKIEPAQVRRIVAVLEEKNRTVEFR